jgi:hypothetical protein
MSRVVVTLNKEERDALIELARREFRHPTTQARYILHHVLHAEGVLVFEDNCCSGVDKEQLNP